MKLVASTGSATRNVKAVVELVVAELVEASKRPQKKANEAGGFDKFSHQER